MEQKYLVLEEDRIFQTCHLLPQPHFVSSGEGSRWNNDIILIGGGTGTFFDRARILNADYDHTPVYRSIARYDLRPMKHDLKGCQEPQQDGKGRWVPEDKTFGYGLNIPRTRHASEIIKTTDVEHGNTTHFVFVFGGYNDEKGGQILDSVESLELETLSSFQLYDFKKEENEWLFRLPWPLMDITSVKIPVEWLPKACYVQYMQGRRRERLQREQARRDAQNEFNLGFDFLG
ncbi:uncharacterized protein LOC131893546 [Tigriopus californicus]|uniref:uncharacterized protein LOC131893546 n=1 Tax=Tigriopus californicus TaxID=6832 RepID=UPI0027DA1727|nr:uncharacterized protein LOC131893546 [Tigriopus californicus]